MSAQFLSPSTLNYDTDSWPLFEPTALALASTARSRQYDVVFHNLRQPNFCSWLQADIQSPEIEVCFTPDSRHREPRQGPSFPRVPKPLPARPNAPRAHAFPQRPCVAPVRHCGNECTSSGTLPRPETTACRADIFFLSPRQRKRSAPACDQDQAQHPEAFFLRLAEYSLCP